MWGALKMWRMMRHVFKERTMMIEKKRATVTGKDNATLNLDRYTRLLRAEELIVFRTGATGSNVPWSPMASNIMSEHLDRL